MKLGLRIAAVVALLLGPGLWALSHRRSLVDRPAVRDPEASTRVPGARGELLVRGHPSRDVPYPSHAGFTLYLAEEFDQPIDLDRDAIWTWGDGALVEGLTRMSPENVTFEDGCLVLRVTDVPRHGGYSHSIADNVAAKPLSSGEVRTIYNNFRFGRYEVRMRAPKASNFLQAMFAFRTPAYLLWREIDVELQAAPSHTFLSNLIVAPPGTRSWSKSIEEPTTSYPTGGNEASALAADFDSTTFHTYAFEWTPSEIKWYVDEKLVRIKKDGEGPNGLRIPAESTKIVLNLWVFVNQNLGGGDPALNHYPIRADYDWFRFYRWDGDAQYPCSPAPACLSRDDLQFAKNNDRDPLPDFRPERCTGPDGMRDVSCGRSAR